MKRVALCDVDAIIVRESDGGPWHTVTGRMTPAEARHLADELREAARYLDGKLNARSGKESK